MAITAYTLRLAEQRFPAFVFTGESWVLMAEERQVNTVDLYWDEPPTDEYPFWEITFMGRDAWYYDRVKHGYRPVVFKGRLTFDGRDLLDRLLHVSPPMVDYSL